MGNENHARSACDQHEVTFGVIACHFSLGDTEFSPALNGGQHSLEGVLFCSFRWPDSLIYLLVDIDNCTV